MKRTWQWALSAVALTVLAGCGGGGETPERETDGGMAMEAPAIPRNADVDDVMVELVDHAAHGLWGLEAAGMMPPESETSWQAVEQYAIQLIAAGSYITYGNPSEMDANWVERTGWKVYSQKLTDAGVKALDAAIRRDANGVLAAGDDLDPVCQGCHEEYRIVLQDDQGT